MAQGLPWNGRSSRFSLKCTVLLSRGPRAWQVPAEDQNDVLVCTITICNKIVFL